MAISDGDYYTAINAASLRMLTWLFLYIPLGGLLPHAAQKTPTPMRGSSKIEN
jgi:hypothetical protein